MSKKGSYYLDVENKYSIRFTYKPSEDKVRNGIIAANKLKGFTLDNSGNPLNKGTLCVAWDNNKVELFNIEDLIAKITRTAQNDVKQLIRAIYHIHNQRHLGKTMDETPSWNHDPGYIPDTFSEEDHLSSEAEFFRWKDQGWE